METTPLNVFGKSIEPCSLNPLTGFYRDGCCTTGREDKGLHTVCIIATEEFLSYSAKVGNDLSTPHPEYMFAGVKPGDRWCLCAMRWIEAYQAGCAPFVVLESTNQDILKYVSFDLLLDYKYIVEV